MVHDICISVCLTFSGKIVSNAKFDFLKDGSKSEAELRGLGGFLFFFITLPKSFGKTPLIYVFLYVLTFLSFFTMCCSITFHIRYFSFDFFFLPVTRKTKPMKNLNSTFRSKMFSSELNGGLHKWTFCSLAAINYSSSQMWPCSIARWPRVAAIYCRESTHVGPEGRRDSTLSQLVVMNSRAQTFFSPIQSQKMLEYTVVR